MGQLGVRVPAEKKGVEDGREGGEGEEEGGGGAGGEGFKKKRWCWGALLCREEEGGRMGTGRWRGCEEKEEGK